MHATPVMNGSPRERLSALLLGRDRKQRLRLQRALLAGGVCAMAIAAVAVGVREGFDAPRPAYRLIGVLCAGLLLFFGVLRSGLNLRAADPNLTLPQVVFAVVGMLAAYALSGPARGGFLTLLSCAIVFAAFALERRPMQAVCIGTLALLLLVGSTMPDLDPRYDRRVELIHFLLALAAFPVIALVVSQTRQQWRAQRRQLADALARIQVLATHDELTGLINRRHMQELLQAEELRSRRSGRSVCIAMLDIDHFKAINDSIGHAGGDRVLKAFADTAIGTARRSDIVARWGGEEFVWLLPETAPDDARCAVQRLRRALPPVEVLAHVSFSAGLTTLAADEHWPTAIARADEALYEAKARGRDQIVWRAAR